MKSNSLNAAAHMDGVSLASLEGLDAKVKSNNRIRFATPVLAAILIGSFSNVAQTQETASANSSATERFEAQLPAADHLQIIDVIARMNHAIDAEDYAGYAAFYTDEGIIDSGFGPLSQGREAIIASLEASAPFITNKRHVAANIVINGEEQSATVIYYLTVFERAASLSLVGTALITDEFRKIDGAWAVLSHTTRMDPATLAVMQSDPQ